MVKYMCTDYHQNNNQVSLASLGIQLPLPCQRVQSKNCLRANSANYDQSVNQMKNLTLTVEDAAIHVNYD